MATVSDPSVSCECDVHTRPVADWRRVRGLAASMLLIGVVQVANGAEEQRFQITPFYSYATGDDFEDEAGGELDVADESGWGIVFNVEEADARYYELLYATYGTEIEGGASPFDLDIDYFQIGGTVAWSEGKRFIPYFGMTIGAAHFSPDLSGLESETRFAFTVGAGVRVPVTPHIGVRAEWRTYVTLLGSDSNLFCASEGGGATCLLRVKSDTFLQHSAQLGVIVGF